METEKLQQYCVKIEQNTAQMERISKRLEADVLSLQNDPDRIALAARSLGYYPDNDGVMYLDGYEKPKNGYSLGSLYRGFHKKHTSISFIRYVSLTSGLLVFLLLVMFERKKNVYSVRQQYSEI